MTHDFSPAMRRATDLVRAGNPVAATQMIQSALGGSGAMQLPAADAGTPYTSARHTKRGLRDTLAGLAARMPSGAPSGTTVEPPLPDGATFSHGTFTCASGSRDYRVYIPSQPAPPAGLVMMLHGCTQSPVDFANGTDMNRLAEAENLIAVYPAQARGANAQSCWNWFAPADQQRGAGEPEILAGMALELARAHGVPEGRIFAAGLSAGAAMAVILGRTYPEVFAAIGAHSGLPYKAAHDVPSAFAAMGGQGGAARGASHQMPTIVFHGTSDTTVAAANGQRIAEDARVKGAELVDDGTAGGRSYRRTTVLADGGNAAMEYWRIDGLGHAWSGGNAAGSYTDTAGPDASAEMIRFFLNTPLKGI